MRAIQARSYGGPEVLELVELPVPTPGPGEALVRIHAVGTNPIDWKARSGMIPGRFGAGPYIWGWDIAGTVEAMGPELELEPDPEPQRWQPGDEVFGMPRFPGLVGGYAEYAAVPAATLVRRPSGLDWIHAAALPLAGLTALQIEDLVGVRSGHRVLINAAAGGVGHLAVQLARERGAYVIGTARAENHEFLRGLGIDEVLDYTRMDVGATMRDIDVVIDAIGDSRLLSTLKPGGVIVPVPSAHATALMAAAQASGLRAVGHLVRPDAAGTTLLAELAEAGRLRVEVSTVLPLAEAARAHELLAQGHTRGKIVLVP